MFNSPRDFNHLIKDYNVEHFPCAIEWWGVEAFFQTLENKKKWSFKGSLTQWLKKDNIPGSNLILTLFDMDKGDNYSYYKRNNSNKIRFDNIKCEARYDNCYIKTCYPDYEMEFIDPKNDIQLYMEYEPLSQPYCVAQNITDGWIPMNLGLSRYMFIPRNKLFGKICIQDTEYNIKGNGYFEHLWGNFSYTNPLKYSHEIIKSISVYSKLFTHWLQARRPKIPKSILFSTENNPLSYDWTWAIFDDGSSLFFGNSLFWIMKGPILGDLIFTQDGKNYIEFFNTQFQYLKTIYMKEYDFYYPSEFDIKAVHKNKRLYLKFKMTVNSHELLMTLSDKKNAFIICESPGLTEGYYDNGKKKIKLKGQCKIESQRQVSRFGHNSLFIDLFLPPKGLGFKSTLDSHYLNKKIFTELRFLPKPNIYFKIKKNIK
jgi:hypothetical protein